jgi:hypothetical protein
MADQAVPRAVEKHRAAEPDETFRTHHPAGHRVDAPGVVGAAGHDLPHVGVEEQRDVRLGPDRVEQHEVPVVRVARRVAVLVLDQQFPHHPAFAGEVVDAVSGGAAHPDPDLAAGVAAEHRPVGDERDLPAEARGGHRRAHPGQPAADDCDV